MKRLKVSASICGNDMLSVQTLEGRYTSETKIYENFTRFIVLLKQRRNTEDARSPWFTGRFTWGWQELFQQYLPSLPLIWSLHTNSHIREKPLVPLSLGTDSNDASSLGLLTIDRTSGLGGHDNTFVFFQLGFREYLSACHFVELNKQEQMEMIIQHARETYMLMVWKFYSSMAKFENNVAQMEQQAKLY